MVTAYANSLKSYCEKRRVGAILTDENGNIISSGFNDAPTGQKSCKAKYGKCYRDHLKDKYKVDNTFKMLDYCRALHAEENAILNLISKDLDYHSIVKYIQQHFHAICVPIKLLN